MNISRSAGVIAGLVMSLMLLGCGDTYRPVVNPFPNPGGDPQNQNTVYVANQGVKPDGTFGPGVPCSDADGCVGSVTGIDVPGDVNEGNHLVGESPWNMLLIGAALYTADRGSNTVSELVPSLVGNTPVTASMPVTVTAQIDRNTSTTINVAPVVYVATSDGTVVYAAMPACAAITNNICSAPDPNSPGIMAVLSSNVFSQAWQVGKNPISITQLPDSSKVYVVNNGSANLSVFAGVDRTPLGTIAVGQGPILAIPTPDSKFLFVLNQADGTISVVNTSTNAVVTASFGSPVPPDPTKPISHPMFYDAKKQYLYVVNSVDSTVSIFDASQLNVGTLGTPRTIHLPANSSPVAVTALADGSRAYVANAGNPGGSPAVAPSVYMIDANSFTVSPISGYIGNGPHSIISSSDGSKVYVVNHDPTLNPSAPAGSNIVLQQPGTNIIVTANNKLLMDNFGHPLNIVAPFQDPVHCTYDTPQPWIAGFNYSINSTVMPNPSNGHAYLATTAGTSGQTAPAFCTSDGCTVSDAGTNPIVWKEIGAPLQCPRQRPSIAIAQ